MMGSDRTEFVKTAEKEDMICLSDGKNRVWCELLDCVLYNGREYAALLQVDDDVPLVLCLKEKNGDAKEYFETVDDDATFNAVCDALEAALNGE